VLKYKKPWKSKKDEKTSTVLDSKPTKSVGHFEENKFSVSGHQFLLDCCTELIKTHNFGQNTVNERQFKTKMNNIVQFGCLISKVVETFVYFPSAIVGIFYCVVTLES
jgi:hypothetical protein